jgi:hypothetical protein
MACMNKMLVRDDEEEEATTIKPQEEHQIQIFDTFERGIEVLCVMFCFVTIYLFVEFLLPTTIFLDFYSFNKCIFTVKKNHAQICKFARVGAPGKCKKFINNSILMHVHTLIFLVNLIKAY